LATDQGLEDIERLFARVGLAHEQLPDIDPERFGVVHVECMLGVDERCDAAGALGLGDRVQRERGLTARLWAEDLDHAPAWIAAAAERAIERRRAAANRWHVLGRALAELHDRALAVLLFDATDGLRDCLQLLLDRHTLLLLLWVRLS